MEIVFKEESYRIMRACFEGSPSFLGVGIPSSTLLRRERGGSPTPKILKKSGAL
jgi:hypothetical protein